MTEFNDFDFDVETDEYTISVHDSYDDDSVVVVDYIKCADVDSFFTETGDVNTEVVHQKLCTSKDELIDFLKSLGVDDAEEECAEIRETTL